MCFDTDALPPDPARSGLGAGPPESTTLTADDGNRLAASIARTTEPAPVGVVVIPDIRGLHRYYEILGERLADAGVPAVVIDPYGRTAGAERRDDDFDHVPHREAVRDEGLRADVRAGAAVLRGEGTPTVATMGFCFGGRGSLMQASQQGIDGVIAFYGPPTGPGDAGRSPIDEARDGLVRAPVLGLYGGADRGIPQEDVEAYERALEEAGVDRRITVYPDAPHSFFDRKMTEFADESRDAWARVLGFVDSLAR
jgi:carboxymethylenebutenolidase